MMRTQPPPPPSDIQLQDLRRPSVPDSEVAVETPLLPPTDHGKSAWLVLLGCVLVQAPVWGYSMAFGIFQDYYTSQGVFPGASAGSIATVGTTQTGIMYLMMPFSFTLLTAYPRLRPWCGPLGLVLTTGSLAGSAYASTVGQLVATQGVVYALGCGLLFSPTSLYLDEWFDARKGLAYGVMWGGKSAVGVAMPFLTSALLPRFGPRATLLGWAAASAVLAVPLLVLLRPRVPLRTTAALARGRGGLRSLGFAFARRPFFWMLWAGAVVQSVGYMMPSTYLASYARAIGQPDATGAAVLAVFALASLVGGVAFGALCDRMPAADVLLICSLGSAAAVLLLWGLSQHLAVLVLFAAAYGFFAGSYSSAWSGILRDMKGRDARDGRGDASTGAGPAAPAPADADAVDTDTGLVFGMLLGGRGLGFVVSGPLSGALLDAGGLAAKSFTGFATQYGPMMICTAVTATLGGWGWYWSAGKKVVKLL